jgi:hypothetical protein
MGLLLSNYKYVETKIEWNHGANSNQLYRPEGSLTGGEASPANTLRSTRTRTSELQVDKHVDVSSTVGIDEQVLPS